ncbi:MAG: N-acetylneuraminate synthase family protein, partial [Chitinophagaceae bacterium]
GSTIQVGHNTIGGDKTFIIAEVGANHCQSLQLAYDHIDAAVACGADAVKFQSINLDELYYQPSEATVALHKQIDFPEEWHPLLKEYCDKKGIVFFSSPTYLRSIDLLEEVNVSLYKLASAQVGTFPQLVKRVAATGKPVILSTGLVSYSELERVVKIFNEAGNPNFIILHCNSIYPTPFHKVHLQLMETYRKMFGCVVGFSDHTEGIAIPTAAVALGAKVIEKHFVLDKTMPSPDAPIAIEPPMFKEMVDAIRAVEQATAPYSRTEIYAEEKGFKDKIATRLFLKADKKAGETLTESDFNFLRYTEGIDCRYMDTAIGRQLKRDLAAGSVLQSADIG